MARQGLFQANIENRGMPLDPRTKLLLLITVMTFVLGGAGGENMTLVVHALCVIPFLLHLSAKKYRTALLYLVLYCASYAAHFYVMPRASGLPGYILLAICAIVNRFLPGIMIGTYVFSTTTVSEFIAAMHRMHVTEKLSIPLSVMFRFFPTVAEEFHAIGAAMKMRGISFGGKNWTKMLEYRLIPLLTCSVQIGSELSAAALAQGLGSDIKRTNICKIGFHIQDLAVLLICLVPFVMLVLSWLGVMR